VIGVLIRTSVWGVALQALGLIGRDRELETFSGLLAARQPAFVVIGGAVGIGKSALLGAMRQLASDDSWYLFPAGDEALTIDDQMSVPSLVTTFEDLVADADRGMERRPFVGLEASTSGDGGSQVPIAAVSSLLAGTRLTSARSRSRAAQGPLDALSQLTPIMVALDVRTPDQAVRSWLTDKLWRAVSDAGIATIIVAVVVDKEDEAALAKSATRVMHLGPLPARAVRLVLEKVTSGLPDSELDGYAEAIRNDPGLLSCFSRLLPLVAAPATSSPSEEDRG